MIRSSSPVDERTLISGRLWGWAVFKEIVEPQRIVCTDSFSDRHGNVTHGMPDKRSTVELSDLGDRARVAIGPVTRPARTSSSCWTWG